MPSLKKKNSLKRVSCPAREERTEVPKSGEQGDVLGGGSEIGPVMLHMTPQIPGSEENSVEVKNTEIEVRGWRLNPIHALKAPDNFIPVEDTSEEAYFRRHRPFELEEKLRKLRTESRKKRLRASRIQEQEDYELFIKCSDDE